jgi:hypothetical protein
MKGEAGAASAAPPANDSDANSSAVLLKLDPDILMASIEVWPSTPKSQTGSSFTAA